MPAGESLKRLTLTQIAKVGTLMAKEQKTAAEPAASKKRTAAAAASPAATKQPKKAPPPPAAKSPKASPAAKASPKEAKPSAKRSSAKKARATEEVRAVECIAKVRLTEKGTTEFLIKWTGLDASENSWEPEENLLDDGLYDEFMMASLAKLHPSGGKYAVGEQVDVLGKEDGFEYSWAPAKVSKIEKSGKLFSVEYAGFEDDAGDKLGEKGVELGRLRPLQPKAAAKWRPALGEVLEVFEDDCWWEGKMVGADPKKKGSVLVVLRVSDERKSYPLARARPSCWWTSACE